MWIMWKPTRQHFKLLAKLRSEDTFLRDKSNTCPGRSNSLPCRYPLEQNMKYCPNCGLVVQSVKENQDSSDDVNASSDFDNEANQKIGQYGDKRSLGFHRILKAEEFESLNTPTRVENSNQETSKENMEKHVRETKIHLQKCDNEPLKIGLTGGSNVGKSSFINLLFEYKVGDPNSVEVGQGHGDTTKEPKTYYHSKNKHFTIDDTPGYGTAHMRKDKFLKTVELSKYDFVLVFIDSFIREDDIWIADQLRNKKIPFMFVRSKIDEYVNKENSRGIETRNAIEELRAKLMETINKEKLLKGVKLFLISNMEATLHIGDWPELLTEILNILPDEKSDTFLLFLPILSPETIEMKYEMLKKRALYCSVGLGARTAVTRNTLEFVSFDTYELIQNELKRYVVSFGLDKEFVCKLEGVKHRLSKQDFLSIDWKIYMLLGLNSLSSLPTDFRPLPLTIPIVFGGTSFLIIRSFLESNLKELKDDALTVYKHFKTNTR